MSFCVGADDSLPENILYKGVKTALAGGLAAAPTSNCVTPKIPDLPICQFDDLPNPFPSGNKFGF